jgi:hypothetical protein
MNRSRLALIAALLGTFSLTALAADPAEDAARRKRMDQAYEDSRNPQPGPAARAENSVKRGASRAGQAVKRGAQKTGQTVGKGVRKTGEAIGRGGSKLEDKSTPKP